jgi:hypothetical protein
MKRALCLFGLWLVLQGGMVEQARAQMTAQDIVTTSAYWFSQQTYVASPGASEVEITVYFSPGDRSYSGWVDYYTEDGTAKAGIDYEAVSGQLYFWGVAFQTFRIPILPGAFLGGEKSFQVFLSNPDAWIWDSPATVALSCAPSLNYSVSGTNLVISWPAACEGYVLDRSERSDFSTWTEVETAAIRSGTRWQVEQPLSGPGQFYRLRKVVESASN